MVLVVSLQLKLLTVWILTGSSGLVLPLGSDWMGANEFYAHIVWSGLVSRSKRFGLVWFAPLHGPHTKNQILRIKHRVYIIKFYQNCLKLVEDDSV